MREVWPQDATLMTGVVRFGWSNTGIDTLHCPVCDTTIVVATPLELTPSDERGSNEALAPLVASLSDAHRAHCGSNCRSGP